MYKSSVRAKASPGFLESEVHVSALINYNLMIFNEVGINRKIFELPVMSHCLIFRSQNYSHESRMNQIK
jgi:hypothetical protein